MSYIRAVLNDFRVLGIFKILFGIYLFINFFAGGEVLLDGEFLLSLQVFFGPIICLFSGAGLKGSLLVSLQKMDFKDLIGGIIMCLISLLISYLIYMKNGFQINIVYFGLVSGYIWCLIGFSIGFLSAKIEDTV